MFSKLTRLHYWIIFGIVIRLILIPLTSHTDTRAYYLGSYFIVYKNSFFGFYDYISKLPRTDPIVKNYGDDLFIYPPAAYLFHSAVLWIEKPIFPLKTYEAVVLDYSQGIKASNYWYLQYLLKSPYLLVDLACLWVILKIVDRKNWLTASAFWALNFPIIYSAYLMGQFDILIVFCFLAAIYFTHRQKPLLSAIFLGLSAGFKPFGLFLLPLLPGSKIKNITLGLITYLIILLPYLPSPGFRQYALFAQQTDKILYAKIPVSGSQFISVFFVGLFLMYLFNLNKSNVNFSKTLITLAAPLFLFYSTVHYHPQWFAWIAPFLLLIFIYYPRYRLPVILLNFLHLLIVLSFDYSLNFGLFGWHFEIFPLLAKYFSPDLLVSLIRTAIAATAFYLYLEELVSKASRESRNE